jgi:hypothetical protein
MGQSTVAAIFALIVISADHTQDRADHARPHQDQHDSGYLFACQPRPGKESRGEVERGVAGVIIVLVLRTSEHALVSNWCQINKKGLATNS